MKQDESQQVLVRLKTILNRLESICREAPMEVKARQEQLAMINMLNNFPVNPYKGWESAISKELHYLCTYINFHLSLLGGKSDLFEPFGKRYQELCECLEFAAQLRVGTINMKLAPENGLFLIIDQVGGVKISKAIVEDISQACRVAWGSKFGSKKGLVWLRIGRPEWQEIDRRKRGNDELTAGADRVSIDISTGNYKSLRAFSRSRIISIVAHEITHVIQHLKPEYVEAAYLSHAGEGIMDKIRLGRKTWESLSEEEYTTIMEYYDLYGKEPTEIEAESFAASYLKAINLVSTDPKGRPEPAARIVSPDLLVLSDVSGDLHWGNKGKTLWLQPQE